VLLDLPPQHGLTRFEGRDRIEAESLEFHERVRETFLQLASGHPEHYLVVDAREPVEQISLEIRARVQPLLEHAARTAVDPAPPPTLVDDTVPRSEP
jgi:dTMP kinase